MKTLSDAKQGQDRKSNNTRKLLKWLLCVIVVFGLLLYVLIYLQSQASVFSSPRTIHVTNIFQSGTNMIKNRSDFAQIKNAQADEFNKNLAKETFVNKWKLHYMRGVPVKPNMSFPTCDQYIKKIKDHRSRFQLLAMYDPGNCAEVPNTHLQVFKNLSLQNEKQEKLVAPLVDELTDLCLKANGSLGDSNWRLCYGMPDEYHFANWVHQRYKYSVNNTNAKQELGQECFDKQISLLILPMNMNHRGGPRKVINNLLNGFRLIGKPYIVNARQLYLFDYLFSPDPHHAYFMYYMGEADAKKFYIGPTVKSSHFDAQRMTTAVRKYSHVLSASKSALMSQQYFPGMPLQPNNSVIIPTGVDEDIFAPPNSVRNNALIYTKFGCFRKIVEQLKKLIKLKITEIIYEKYNETYFRKALGAARYAIVCDGAETQGIAMEEMMAMDVPLFVTNNNTVPYFSDEVGVILSKDTPLDTTFIKFVRNVDKGIYRPRKWLVENLGIVNSVINTLKEFCGLPNKWNPPRKKT